MIVADKTCVNIGKINGIVILLQRLFAQKCLKEPQFICCQNSILDRNLCVISDSELEEKGHRPILNIHSS